jgi:hypothetical protein
MAASVRDSEVPLSKGPFNSQLRPLDHGNWHSYISLDGAKATDTSPVSSCNHLRGQDVTQNIAQLTPGKGRHSLPEYELVRLFNHVPEHQERTQAP